MPNIYVLSKSYSQSEQLSRNKIIYTYVYFGQYLQAVQYFLLSKLLQLSTRRLILVLQAFHMRNTEISISYPLVQVTLTLLCKTPVAIVNYTTNPSFNNMTLKQLQLPVFKILSLSKNMFQNKVILCSFFFGHKSY